MDVEVWKQRARKLKREVYVVYFACRDPRVPWYARLLAIGVVAYAFSPIDLIPDPIPVLGYLDDLIVIPLGIGLALRLIPPSVLAECRAKAEAAFDGSHRSGWIAAGVIVVFWLTLAGLAAAFMMRLIKS